ncbi:MAG: hypothetical protein ABA06_03105 [Parcubacteria bacterium C7867-001]|nr:MAG: hypothetical protein ABA06_03105 [Parcubacteria bacterium C7867-001]
MSDQNATVPQPSSTPQAHSSLGGLISIILIVALVIIGALYVWGQRIATTDIPEETNGPQPTQQVDNGAVQPI